MVTHHKANISVLGLITSLLVRALSSYIRSVAGSIPRRIIVRYDWKRKAAYVGIPIDIDRGKYWWFVVIASDSKDPWSPSEVFERIRKTWFRGFYSFMRREFGPFWHQAFFAGTVLFVGSISRGAYLDEAQPLDRINTSGANVYCLTRDIRNFVRWLRQVARQGILSIWRNAEEAKEELLWRLAREMKSLFRYLANVFEDRANDIAHRSKMKGVEPYGPVKRLIVALRMVKEQFERLVMFAEGRFDLPPVSVVDIVGW